jgi:hypothetical protein
VFGRSFHLVVCAIACCAVCPTVHAAEPTADEYAVYHAFLSAHLDDWSIHASIAAETADGTESFGGAKLREYFPDQACCEGIFKRPAPYALEEGLWEAFRRVDAEVVRLDLSRRNGRPGASTCGCLRTHGGPWAS